MSTNSKSSLFKQLEKSELNTLIPLDEVLRAIPWNEQGLVPVIAQDALTKDVLMLAWANEEAIRLTVELSQGHYYSRSRKAMWRKGESSGNVQQITGVSLDCDGDAVLYQVIQSGPACHTNRKNCFYWSMSPEGARITSEPVTRVSQK
ncbi:MAG: phosphoribosyl-AMP cyclohydrolase [Gammaproteobacteria bacterium]|nr:phosphoribosyl-AMP cyclohydrolase [Gammaproteobacteria bacterium]HBF08390.1 phosphoribosyl-AMP cyclohydrolase [Gammaproteobacteria bacterium]|tara:strand:+ start:327 stop:770 length:444 start_codon:yes stop_codon:yes gene_type:complete